MVACHEDHRVEPLDHGLIFERFLNPERIPCLTLTLTSTNGRRDEVIAYVKRKYKRTASARLSPTARLKTKQALKDSARILGI